MDARTIIEAMFTITGFFAAAYLRTIRNDISSIRTDVAAITKKVGTHGEDIAALKTDVKYLDKRLAVVK